MQSAHISAALVMVPDRSLIQQVCLVKVPTDPDRTSAEIVQGPRPRSGIGLRRGRTAVARPVIPLAHPKDAGVCQPTSVGVLARGVQAGSVDRVAGHCEGVPVRCGGGHNRAGILVDGAIWIRRNENLRGCTSGETQ